MKRIGNHIFQPLISEEALDSRIKELANYLEITFDPSETLLVEVLKGAKPFAQGLRSHLTEAFAWADIRVKSYAGTASTGKLDILNWNCTSPEGKAIVLIEDIVDTGLTVHFLEKRFLELGAKEVSTLSLLVKPNSVKFDLSFVKAGFNLNDTFVVGFGLDLNEEGRDWNSIYSLKNIEMLNLVLFGPPGAGKGTQSAFLVEKYGLIHLSTGDLLRGEIAAQTKLGMEAKSIMDRGELVSDAIVIGMIRSKLDSNPEAKGFIFDGFPRTHAQAEALDEVLNEKNTSISMMISLEVPVQVLVERLLLRGKDSGRADDQNEEVIQNRISEYNKKTAVLKSYYGDQGKVKEIQGVGSIEEISERISAAIQD